MPLFDIFEQARKEFGWPIELDKEYCSHLVAIFSKPGMFLEWTDHGFLAGHIGFHILMPGVTLALETAWYVLPEYRNKLEGGRLYKMFEEWAVENEAEYILQGIETRGCTKVGPFYLRKL